MNKVEFDLLNKNLGEVCEHIPMWGCKQNREDNSLISLSKVTKLYTLSDLNNYLVREGIPKDKFDYCQRRWFHVQCAWIDEYLFYKQEGVKQNPNEYSKEWDVEFPSGDRYDIKSTIIPNWMRKKFSLTELFNMSNTIINTLDYSASNSRSHNQNRMYILHYSKKGNDQTSLDRVSCAFDFKDKVFKYVANNIEDLKVYNHNGYDVILVYIIEQEDGDFKMHLEYKD